MTASCACWRPRARSAPALLPGVPTVDEAGVKGYEVMSWNGVAAPKGTPKDVIDTMNKAMHEVLAMPELKAKFQKVGVGRACLDAGRADGPAHVRHQEMGCGDRIKSAALPAGASETCSRPDTAVYGPPYSQAMPS